MLLGTDGDLGRRVTAAAELTVLPTPGTPGADAGFHTHSELLASHEVIVVDNNSGDGISEFLAKNYPGVRVIALAVNLGCGGRNLGVEAARARDQRKTSQNSRCTILDDTPGALNVAAQDIDGRPGLQRDKKLEDLPGLHARRNGTVW